LPEPNWFSFYLHHLGFAVVSSIQLFFFSTAVKTNMTPWIIGMTFFYDFGPCKKTNFSPAADWKNCQPYDLNERFLMTRFVWNWIHRVLPALILRALFFVTGRTRNCQNSF
jgi:hypothetical protein